MGPNRSSSFPPPCSGPDRVVGFPPRAPISRSGRFPRGGGPPPPPSFAPKGFGAPPPTPQSPVRIDLRGAGPASILDHARQEVRSTPGGAAVWQTTLPLGFYEVVAQTSSRLFKVTGSIAETGAPEVVHVS